MPSQWIEAGRPSAPIWLLGEAPGFYEERDRRPFVGPTGKILNECLSEIGIARSDCFLSNICHQRPPTYTDKHGKRVENDIEQFFLGPKAAKQQNIPEYRGRYALQPITEGIERFRTLVEQHRPKICVLLGNTPLWAITGNMGITKWRGSIVDTEHTRTIACFHPADCLPARSPQHRPLIVHDLNRAKRELKCPSPQPDWQHCIEPKLADVRDWLSEHRGKPLTCDIETRANQIACIGLASSGTEAICIPFMNAQPSQHGYSYWSPKDEELIISGLLTPTLTASSPITFHNGLFDCQYIARQWGVMPNYTDDTMVMQHVLFPGLLGGKIDAVTGRVDKRGSSLSLAFISSLYCRHYQFWKDDGRLYDPDLHDERRYWTYNCVDACRTYECRYALEPLIRNARLWDQYRFEMSCIPLTLRMMFRGLRVDKEEMNAQREYILDEMKSTSEWLNHVTGHDFNPESNPQMRALFYHDLALPIRRDKHTRNPSLKDFDLERIKQSNPLLDPLISKIQYYRTLDTIKNDVRTKPYYDESKRRMHYPLSLSDDRLRCTLNPDYVETMRYSSNETAFSEGGNLQNIPRSPE